MSWNYCPWCSHRIYQHNDAGCTWIEVRPAPVDALWAQTPQAKINPPKPIEVPCDCTHPHPLLIEHSRC